MAITVMLADDHTIVREGIRSVIDRKAPFEIEIIGEASNGNELLTMAEQRAADVYIIDIGMPGYDGMVTAEKLKKIQQCAKIILFTVYRDKTMVQRAFRIGVHGYLLKDSSSEELIEAIRRVYHGGTYISALISHYLEPGTYRIAPEIPLTERQREIFTLICDGLTERDIAFRLNISVNTVHVHKTNIMKNLDMHSKTELIRYGMRERLIPPVV